MKLHVARSLLRGLAVNTVIPVGGVYIMRVAQVPDTVGSAAMTVPAYTPVDMDASVNKVPLLRPDVTTLSRPRAGKVALVDKRQPVEVGTSTELWPLQGWSGMHTSRGQQSSRLWTAWCRGNMCDKPEPAGMRGVGARGRGGGAGTTATKARCITPFAGCAR